MTKSNHEEISDWISDLIYIKCRQHTWKVCNEGKQLQYKDFLTASEGLMSDPTAKIRHPCIHIDHNCRAAEDGGSLTLIRLELGSQSCLSASLPARWVPLYSCYGRQIDIYIYKFIYIFIAHTYICRYIYTYTYTYMCIYIYIYFMP